LCSGDPDDYFYVDLASATVLVLDLTNLPSGTDYDLVLYNAAGGKLTESRNYGSAAERISRSVAAGRYFMRVYPNGAAQQPGLPADRILGRGGAGRGACGGHGVGQTADRDPVDQR
jgi:hypothetical protein